MEALIDRVLERIQEDIEQGDLTAIVELLKFVPQENLIYFLSEEEWGTYGYKEGDN
jgi:hypothetical protein